MLRQAEHIPTPPSAAVVGADAIAAATQSARQAQERWRHIDLRRRLEIVRRLRHRIAERGHELAACIAIEGRDLWTSLSAEVIPFADACRLMERRAERILRPACWGWWTRPFWLMSTRLEVRREPYGVVLIIGPGNYPLLLPGIQALQAIVAGNAVLIKPAPGGGEPMHRLRQWLVECGLEPALLTILDPDVASVEQALVAGVDKVVLTGSAETGRELLGRLAPSLVPSVMELSGCDAVIICEDADIEMAARAIAFGTLLNGGRTCIAPRRVFVHAAQREALEERLLGLLRNAPPVPVRPATAEALRTLLGEAGREGARVLCGGVDPSEPRVKPVLVGDARPGMRLLQADIFAPVLSLVSVTDERQALEWNARCPYALAATIFGRRNAADLAREIDAGVVVINDMIAPHADPRLPFAPRRWSGFGVTRGPEGLLEMTRPKAIATRGGRLRPHLDAPRPEDERLFREYLLAAHGPSIGARLRAAGRLVRALIQRARSNGASS